MIIEVYEVLRVIKSKALFAQDHYERLCKSIQGVNSNVHIAPKQYFNEINNCINAHKLFEANIKIIVKVEMHSNLTTMQCIEIPHKYPAESDYTHGVKTITLSAERDNPELKVWNNELRKLTDNLIKTENAYEVIYINKNQCLTEGSRSNLFFIDSNNLISAPATQILEGITRKYILKIAEKINLNIIETDIHYDTIQKIDSCFISGTSPKILPVKEIDEICFDVKNQYLLELIKLYDELISEYIHL